jgi:hypothetical protein
MYVLDFFDKEKFCREDLQELKKQYFEELEKLDPASCSSCERSRIRNKYLKLLTEGNYGF